MIGEFNRDNPYIIQLLESTESIELTSIKITREFVYTVIVIILSGIFSLLIFLMPFKFAGILFPATTTVVIVTILFLYRILQEVLTSSPLREINQIVYGKQYERIYVNNERLLKLIQEVTNFKGKAYILSRVLRMLRIISLTIIPCVLFIRLMILFFI